MQTERTYSGVFCVPMELYKRFEKIVADNGSTVNNELTELVGLYCYEARNPVSINKLGELDSKYYALKGQVYELTSKVERLSAVVEVLLEDESTKDVESSVLGDK